jgi:hypothetical protein
LIRTPTDLELDYGTALAQQRIAERVKEREHRAWQESKRMGIAFVGARRVLRQAHPKRARSYEAYGSLNPQFAAAGHQGAATEAVRRLRAFNAQYDEALAAWTAGNRTGARCWSPPEPRSLHHDGQAKARKRPFLSLSQLTG